MITIDHDGISYTFDTKQTIGRRITRQAIVAKLYELAKQSLSGNTPPNDISIMIVEYATWLTAFVDTDDTPSWYVSTMATDAILWAAFEAWQELPESLFEAVVSAWRKPLELGNDEKKA